MPSLARRKLLNSTMTVVTGLCALFAVASLFFILGYIFWGGVRGLSFAFLVNSPKPIGEPGSGIANAIVGSVILIALGSLIGMPVGILGGIYLSEFGSNKFGLAASLSDRHAHRNSVDTRRRVCMDGNGSSNGSLFGVVRRCGSRNNDDADSRPHDGRDDTGLCRRA